MKREYTEDNENRIYRSYKIKGILLLNLCALSEGGRGGVREGKFEGTI
jgi:hypothetical protein